MSDLKPSKMKSAFSSGIILGLALTVFTLATYLLELYIYQWVQYLNWVVFIGGIVIFTKKYRDEVCNGVISYGGALGYGVLLSLFASIVVSIVNYVYLGYVDSGFIDYTLEQQEAGMYEQNVPEEQIEVAMEYTRKFTSPIMMAIWGIVGSVFFGLIISLVTSAFLKKEADSFDEA